MTGIFFSAKIFVLGRDEYANKQMLSLLVQMFVCTFVERMATMNTAYSGNRRFSRLCLQFIKV